MHALPLMQVRLTLRSVPNMYATFLIIFENFFPSSTFFHLQKQKPSPIFTFCNLPINHLRLKSVPLTRLLGPTRSLIRNLRVYNLIVYDAKDDILLGIYLSLVGGQAFNLSRLKIIYMLHLYVMYIHNGVKQFM